MAGRGHRPEDYTNYLPRMYPCAITTTLITESKFSVNIQFNGVMLPTPLTLEQCQIDEHISHNTIEVAITPESFMEWMALLEDLKKNIEIMREVDG